MARQPTIASLQRALKAANNRTAAKAKLIHTLDASMTAAQAEWKDERATLVSNYEVMQRNRDRLAAERDQYKAAHIAADKELSDVHAQLSGTRQDLDRAKTEVARMKGWVEGVLASQFPKAPTPPWARPEGSRF